MKKQYAVLGMGSFGASMAVTLQSLDCDVIAVDSDEEKINDIADQVSSAMIADAQDTDFLQTLGVQNLDGVIVAIADDMEAGVLATLSLKEMGANYIMAIAKDERQGKVLKKVGADRVIYPEQEIGERLARNLASGSFSDWIALSEEYSILEIPVPQSWVGQSLTQLDVRKNYGVNVIGLKEGDDVQVSLDTEAPFTADQRLIIIGENQRLGEIR